jgi:pantetheine-phosphate adenylyltransferase
LTQKIALYPGSFDPVHYGHIDIAQRGAVLFDHLVVGVYAHPKKMLLFSVEERVDMMKTALADLDNVTVRAYTGLTVAFAQSIEAQVLVRGLRVISDFEMEYQMALTNQQLCPGLDTICLMTRYEYAFLSASLVKEVFMAGGNVSQMVTSHVLAALARKRDHLSVEHGDAPIVTL